MYEIPLMSPGQGRKFGKLRQERNFHGSHRTVPLFGDDQFRLGGL
jgi:hypothetical protein